MDDSNSTPGKSRNLTYILIFVLILIVIVLLGGGFYLNHSKINQLTKSLNETQKQVQDVKNQKEENKENVANDVVGGVKNTADAIKDVDNPVVRLALGKAYAAALRPYLAKANQADLDAILLYVNGNPKVLVTKNPVLPKDVSLAVNNLQTAVRNLKIAGVATIQKIDTATFTQGEIVNLTGTLTYVSDDPELNGSVFTLTDSETGYVYYLEFNEANSKVIEDTMDGKEVSVTVKVTSKANEPLTFQVIKGPTLVIPTPSSTKAKISPAPSPAPTQ